MKTPQLELVTLKVTPEEARMLCTALTARAMHLADIEGSEGLRGHYVELRYKIYQQVTL